MLLDADQEQPAEVDEYFLRWRVHYERYAPARHAGTKLLTWQTEAWHNEYDVPPCVPGTPPSACVHRITSNFTLADMKVRCASISGDEECGAIPDNVSVDVPMLYAHGHAPALMSIELYDAATGTLICGIVPRFGTGADASYLHSLPPCLFDGRVHPMPVIHPNTTLRSVARYNATTRHYGVMAYWFINVAPRT